MLGCVQFVVASYAIILLSQRNRNTPAEAARDSLMEELEEILAGGLGGTNHFLVHGDGRTEEDEEGGSQKGEAQE